MVVVSHGFALWALSGRFRRSRGRCEATVLMPLVPGSLSEDLFVVDGWGFHLAAGVATPVVVGVDERSVCAAGLGFGGEMPA